MNSMNYALSSLIALAAFSSSAYANDPKTTDAAEPTATEAAGEVVTDAWITTKVKADLLATDNVSGTAVSVDTKDGVVTLSGTVKSQAEADKAVALAEGIKGVTKVVSQVKVEASGE